MKYLLFIFYTAIFAFTLHAQNERQAPAYPLITHDPYFSVWAMNDDITAAPTAHWTGAPNPLVGLITVDGEAYRFLGEEAVSYRGILPASQVGLITETDPGEGWQSVDYATDGAWREAVAPFGNEGEATTAWTSDKIWFRKRFDLASLDFEAPYLKVAHDDDVRAYLNGELLYECERCYTGPDAFEYYRLPQAALDKLRKKDNVLAVHVKDNGGGRWLNAGIVDRIRPATTIAAGRQTALDFTATQTAYTLECGGVDVRLTFTSPLLMDDLDLLSRPVSYVSITTTPNDGAAHDVRVYFGASSLLASNNAGESMVADGGETPSLTYRTVGTQEQPILQKRGDDLRINWGYLYVATPEASGAEQRILSHREAAANFAGGASADDRQTGEHLVVSTVFPQTRITEAKEHLILLGYDDRYSIDYFGDRLRPWWNDDGASSLPEQLESAYTDRASVLDRCTAFDEQLREDGIAAGGEAYAELLEIGYRQAIAAHKLVKSPDGETLFLSKENNSNGSINTVDVTYPSAPLFLAYEPELMKGMLNGIFYYSESGKWGKPFPAHDLGTYPIATGQTYGEDMPVEEAGNVIILTAAIVRAEGDAEYARRHWKSLTQWADYLAEEGLDPANQLSTDDFSGHLARNANLSVKAIVGVSCYAYLAEQLGETGTAEKYDAKAKEMAGEWLKLADAGDHYVLAFGNPDTWSQKYNLVWDKLLQLGLFPQEVYDKELAYYATKNNPYGLPLDNRSDYSKSDWIIWTATLAGSREEFKKFADPVHRFAVETEDRVPMSDWHWTSSGERRGFKARSVVGGYFIKLLADKWAEDAR